MSSSLSAMLVGLPDTGKTTFLAALWHVLESGETASALTLRASPSDSTYLNEIRQSWERAEPVRRTPAASIEDIVLQLQLADRELDLAVPDLSGENYRELWSAHRC